MTRRRIVLLLIIMAAWIHLALSQQRHSGSSYVAQPDGSKAIFTLFERLKLPVSRFLYPFTALDAANRNAALFVVAPETLGHETQLLDWVKQGNRVVYFDTRPLTSKRLVHALGMAERKDASTITELLYDKDAHEPFLLQREMPFVHEISLSGAHPYAPPDGADPLLMHDGDVRAFRLRMGKGDLWFFSDANAILNEHIDQTDNMKLWLTLAQNSSKIFFDEFHHGFTAPVSATRRARWQAIAYFIGFLVVWFLAGMLSRAVRFGPPTIVAENPPAAAADYVTALGLLYHEHGAASMLRRYITAWRRRLERATGISRTIPHGQCVEDLINRKLVNEAAGQRILQILEKAASLQDGEEMLWEGHLGLLETTLADAELEKEAELEKNRAETSSTDNMAESVSNAA